MSGRQGERARRSWPPDEARWNAFIVGYEWGITYGTTRGHAEGYREAMTVLDEAGAFLAEQRPWSVPSFAELQRIRYGRRVPSVSPAQMRVQAARSWGLQPHPEDLAQLEAEAEAARQRERIPEPVARTAASAADTAARGSEEAAAEELTDDDDWAWQA